MAPNPMYSPHLQYAPSFRWGGREWTINDADEFRRRLGPRYARWARRHPTAAKVFDPIESQIYSQFQPLLTGIEAERKRRADYYQRLMGDLGGFTTAVMGMLGGIAPAIGGAYSQGADAMQAAGTGAGAMLNRDAAATAAAANETLGNIGAPEGQQLQGGDAGGALAGLAGWIPSTLLGQQGAAFAEAAGQLPKTASIESQLMMKDLLRNAMEEDDEFSSKVLEVLQGLPGYRQQLQDDMSQRALAQQKFELERLESERDWYLKQAALASAMGDDKRANQYLKLARQREKRMLQAERADQNARKGLDAQGNLLPGYRRNPKTGRIEKIPSSSSRGGSTSSTVPGTPAYNAKALKEVGEARADIEEDAEKMLEGVVVSAMGPQTPETTRRLKEAEQKLWRKYKHLATTPKAKKELRRAIREIVYEPREAASASTGGGSLGSLLEP